MDVLLPLGEAPVANQANAAPEGLFASLLASLATPNPANADSLVSELMPEASPRADEHESIEGAPNPFAALLAALPTALPNAPAAPQQATSGGTSIEQLESTAHKPAATPSEQLLPPNFATPAAHSSQQTDAPATPEPLQVIAAQPVVAVAPAEVPLAAAAPTEAAMTPTEAAVPMQAPQAQRPTEPPARPPDKPVDGAATPSASAEVTSVVRSVGNAQSETGTPGEGEQETTNTPVRPNEPRASARGIEQAAPNSAVGGLAPASSSDPAAAAVTEAPSAVAAEVPPAVEQVATTVFEHTEIGGGEARIHLDPVELGEVTIHVHTDGDSVRIEVRAERPEAAQLLRDHTQDLSNLLGERGLNLSDVNVGLGRGQAGQDQNDTSQRNRPVDGEFAAILGLDDAAPAAAHNRLRAAYNPDGAHLYRI